MLPFRCNSKIDEHKTIEEDVVVSEEEAEFGGDIDEYGIGVRERLAFWAAFKLLDTDGDGVLTPRTTRNILVALNREITQEVIINIETYCKSETCDGEIGMDFKDFYQYLGSQIVGTGDESELRNAFEAFGSVFRMDNPVPAGFTDVAELRHYLKHRGLKLTDEEIDYLWKGENCWILEEKKVKTELLIKKLMEESNTTTNT